MKLVHYSNEDIPFLEERSYDQKDLHWWSKPNGLWMSVEDEDVGENWKEWCENNNFYLENLVNKYEITLQDNANIIYLRTPSEIFSFSKEYPSNRRGIPSAFVTCELDWEAVRIEYQGIIISPYQWDCRLSLDSEWYYGWDCSSGCIWDLNCIKEINKL